MRQRFADAGTASVLLAPVLLACGFLLSACSTTDVAPINAPVTEALGGANLAADVFAQEAGSDSLVGVTFSGGGTRAAAFSFGVLKAFAATAVTTAPARPVTLLDRIDFVSGVSGGSVTAAYFGYKGKGALDDFRERFLLRDAEENLHTSILRPSNVMRVLSGGANDRSNLPQWLDQNLFDGATFETILARKRPIVWLNASDIVNQTPFVFEPNVFRSFCSDLSKLPLSEAVAASAAVPVVFAPITLETFPERCAYPAPAWVRYADEQPNAPAVLKAFARALKAYRDKTKMSSVRLLDGGITDNFGLSGLTLARAEADTLYGPLSPRQATRLRHALFITVNSGSATNTDWARSSDTPGMMPVLQAVLDTGINSTERLGFDAFQLTISRWQSDLIDWRCKLSAAEVRKYRGSTSGWNCRDVKFYAGEIAFDQLPDKKDQLQAIVTSFKLPQDQVDLLIDAGQEAVARNPVINGFLSAARSPAHGDRAAVPPGAQALHKSQ